MTPYRVVPPPEWIDYNDHLTEGYYGMAFADATDWVLEEAGFDGSYRVTHGTFFTVETHIWFVKEVKAGEELVVTTTVLGADPKRLHLWSEMTAGGELRAQQEAMLLHVRADSRRVGAMEEPLAGRFAALAAEHASRPRHPRAGTGVRGMPGG